MKKILLSFVIIIVLAMGISVPVFAVTPVIPD